MDVRRYLTGEIKRARRKMNLARLLDSGIVFAAAGGIAGMLCELASLIRPFYYANLAAGLCFGAGLLAGIGYGGYRRADMKQAARRLDSFGLKERMLTAYENMDEEGGIARLQREDALLHYKKIRDRIQIPILPDKRHILALVVSIAAVAGMSLIPSPVRDQARLRHQVQEEAKEEQEKLKELLEALDGVDMDSLTEEQRSQLQELVEAMELSREELARTDSWESLASAVERLDYKYRQAAQSIESLAAGMEDPGSASASALADADLVAASALADAATLAKAAANRSGQTMASAQASASVQGEGNDSSSSGQGDGNGSGNGSSDGTGNESGQGQGNGSGSGNDQGDGSGSGNGQGDGSGNGSSQGDGTGNDGGQGDGGGTGNGGQGDGSGNGQGGGSGSGSGQGQGSSTGSGTGNGRGTGSSDQAHDYVSVPNALANDPSLTGDKNGDQDSEHYRQQNGLAWEGDHVDYSSVIGQYTDSAYEGIANGKYPSGMESVIRDYFENLNK